MTRAERQLQKGHREPLPSGDLTALWRAYENADARAHPGFLTRRVEGRGSRGAASPEAPGWVGLPLLLRRLYPENSCSVPTAAALAEGQKKPNLLKLGALKGRL